MTDAEDIDLLDEIAAHRREIERLRGVTVDMGARIAELKNSEKIARISRTTSRLARDMKGMADDGLFESSCDFGAHLAACIGVMFHKMDEGEIEGIDGRQVFDAFLSLMVRRKVQLDGVQAGATQN
jgi:hypothetical protein